MFSRCLPVIAALVLVIPAPARSQGVTGASADFWVAMGRFTRSTDAPRTGKEVPPDLSGHYDVEGVAPGDSGKAYSTTMEVKRWKTLTTPHGVKFNTYKFTYNWDPKVDGIGFVIGNRFYYAFGSDHLDLYAGAPLVLSEGENQVYSKYFELYHRTEYKDNTKYVKNRPWFYTLANDYSASGYPPAYWFMWLSANGAHGYDLLTEVPAWRAGEFSGRDGSFQDDGDLEVYKTGMVGRPKTYFNRWHLSDQGMNTAVSFTDINKKTTSGAGMLLEDGLVVMMDGGNDDSGYGYYEVKGKQLTGPYANLNGEHRGTETLKPSADVVARNAAVFGQ